VEEHNHTLPQGVRQQWRRSGGLPGEGTVESLRQRVANPMGPKGCIPLVWQTVPPRALAPRHGAQGGKEFTRRKGAVSSGAVAGCGLHRGERHIHTIQQDLLCRQIDLALAEEAPSIAIKEGS
jgi:hypothetical protein